MMADKSSPSNSVGDQQLLVNNYNYTRLQCMLKEVKPCVVLIKFDKVCAGAVLGFLTTFRLGILFLN
jgi:hypothetical protein